jgi:hypothetical protein
VERCFAWVARFRRLARDYERLPLTFAGLHVVAFVILMLAKPTATFDLVHNTLWVNARSKILFSGRRNKAGVQAG